MHKNLHFLGGKAARLLGAFVLTTFASCVDYPVGPGNLSTGYGANRYSSRYGPNYGSGYGSSYGSGYRSGYGSGYGYGYAGLNNLGNYHYYPRYSTYYNPQSRQYYCPQGSNWQARSSPYGVSSRTLFASPHVPLNLQGGPSNHHGMVAQSYPRNWSPPGHNSGNHSSSGHGSSSHHNR